MFGWVKRLVVDAVDHREVHTLGRRGDHHPTRAGVDVGLGLFAFGKAPGALEHEIHAERLPRQLRRVGNRCHLDRLPVHLEAFPGELHIGVEATVDGVVLEQMSQRLRVGDVVDRDDVEGGVTEGLAEDQSADTAEAIDRNTESHASSFRT